MPPMMFALRMVWAEPLRLPLRIFWMKPGMSMPVGQAVVHGACVTEIAAVGVDDRLGRRQRRMHVRKVGCDLSVAQTTRTDVRAAVGGFSDGFRHRLTGRGALSSICFLTAS